MDRIGPHFAALFGTAKYLANHCEDEINRRELDLAQRDINTHKLDQDASYPKCVQQAKRALEAHLPALQKAHRWILKCQHEETDPKKKKYLKDTCHNPDVHLLDICNNLGLRSLMAVKAALGKKAAAVFSRYANT